MSYETAASWGGTIASVLFTVFFIGVLIFIFRPGSTETYEKLARAPLEDDDIGEENNG
ncbi:MAG TPA: cbb3-type cytochrome c oxidase subunit 3 [Thermopetrobacter sp.]|nr:cbb3-type cytochrome c oxidase subunit 3 [Thermopetrobacter sp.]